MKFNLFKFILILTAILNHIGCQISLMKFHEAQKTLALIIKSVKENQFSKLSGNNHQSCDRSNHCCLCKKQYKSATFVELHMNIHHPITHKNPQNLMLIQIFDKQINKQFRFQTCIKYFQFASFQEILSKYQNSWGDKNQNGTVIDQRSFNKNKQEIKVINRNGNSIVQIVEICTIAAYGVHQKPLWAFWVKGTFIFIFVIVAIVYYANLLQKISDRYFKVKKQTNSALRPSYEEVSDQQI